MLRLRLFQVCYVAVNICVWLFFLFYQADAHANKSLTTLTLIENTLAAIPYCLHYKVTGICYWLDCQVTNCEVVTTPKVSHYLPDAVVTVYRQENSDPWDYANHVIDPPAYQVGEQQMQNHFGVKLADGYESVSSPVDNDAHFKEVDVIGNPAITVLKNTNPLLLPSVAHPLMPYYLSLADTSMWRSPQREMKLYPQYLLPGVHIIGSLLDDWGPVYPRSGFLDQPADAKAAAVIALRAAHIATRTAQPHLYHELLSGDSGKHFKVSEVNENNPHTQWQMIYPIAQTRCTVFGANDLNQPHPWGSQAAVAGDGNYAWVLWRFYQGCIPHAGKFLGSTNF